MTASQQYGLIEVGAADYNSIVGNNVRGNLVAGIVKVGLNTLVDDNPGYPTRHTGTFPFYAGSLVCTFTHSMMAVPSLMYLTPQTNPSMIAAYATNVGSWSGSLAVAALSTTINATLFYNYLVER